MLGRTYHLDGSSNGPEESDPVFDEHHLRTFKERFNYVDSSNQAAVPSRMKEFFDQRPKDQPYFLWVNFNDPHHPWDAARIRRSSEIEGARLFAGPAGSAEGSL